MIEYIATSMTIIGVVLNIKKNRLCFLIWFVGNSLWIYVSIKAGLYGMALTQVVMCGTCIWGWHSWGEKPMATGGNYSGPVPPMMDTSKLGLKLVKDIFKRS